MAEQVELEYQRFVVELALLVLNLLLTIGGRSNSIVPSSNLVVGQSLELAVQMMFVASRPVVV